MSALQERRKAAGLSQSELARKAEVPVRTIQHFEQGTMDINKAAVVTVLRLAEALGCEIQDLLELQKNKNGGQ